MKVKITYEYDAIADPMSPCWAKSGNVFRSGKNWSIARERLIWSLQRQEKAKHTIPEPEEVEL